MSAQRRTTVSKEAPRAPVAKPAPKPAAAPPAPKPTTQAKPATQPKHAPVTQASAVALRTESVRKLVRESVAEMKKINWPDQQTTRSLTVLVIGISIFLGLLLGGIDYLLVKLLQAF